MHNGKHAPSNGHPQPASAASPPAPMKSIKLVLRQKTAPKVPQDGPPGTPLEVLERELPPRAAFVDQIPLADIVERLVQDAYSKLVELSDTLPGTAANARARDIETYATETRKKFLKAYVLSKWAKSAYDVETSMAIYAYLEEHGTQIDHVVQQLAEIKSLVRGARLRNADLVTALTVLTQPPSKRKELLPTIIRDMYTVTKPLSASEIKETLLALNDVLRLRLRMWELIPLEWSKYTIDNGRVYFTCMGLFTASFSVTGPEATDTWYIIDMEFLLGVGGPAQEHVLGVFPRKVPPPLWAQIVPGVNNELTVNMTELEAQGRAQASEVDEASEDKAGLSLDGGDSSSIEVVDAPLIRAFNLLQTLSLSYQLEILIYQVQRLRSLGWSDYLHAGISRDRRAMSIRYWMRSATHHPSRPPNAPLPPQLSTHGGVITIALETHVDGAPNNSKPSKARHTKIKNVHARRMARELDQRFTLEAVKRARRTRSPERDQPVQQSDFVENAEIIAHWEASPNFLGVALPVDLLETEPSELEIDPCALDCEAIIKVGARRHARLILRHWQMQIQGLQWRKYLAFPDGATLMNDDETPCLRLALFQDLILHISIDLRSGRLILRDAGDLAAWERGYRFARYAKPLNENPHHLLDVIQNLRFNTILEAVELQVSYIGLQSIRTLLPPLELQKFGDIAPGYLFINLTTLPSYYLVIIVTVDGFKHALINTARELVDKQTKVVVRDLGWLDPEKLGLGLIPNDFAVRPHVLREMYAFACARVSHTIVEQQLKSRGIPYTSIFPSLVLDPAAQRNRAIPVLRILARDLWPNASDDAEEGACQNVKLSVMNWWNQRPPQIVTEVKLKSPPPLSLISSRSRNQPVSGPGLRANSLVSYDPNTSIVSFLSSDVDVAIDELQGEWDRVQKTLAIARHVSNMTRSKGYEDVRLLSFNLLAMEFTYQSDFVAAIEYIPPTLVLQAGLLPTGTFQVSFSRISPDGSKSVRAVTGAPLPNPHQEIASYLSPRLIEGNSEQTRQAVQEFVLLLRSTLPVLQELESIRENAALARRKSLACLKVSVVYKSAAWFRILYGITYALDVRVLVGGEVAILDGTCSLLRLPKSHDEGQQQPIVGIPRLDQLADIVITVLRQESIQVAGPTALYGIGNGLRCTENLARMALRRLHESILESLLELSS